MADNFCIEYLFELLSYRIRAQYGSPEMQKRLHSLALGGASLMGLEFCSLGT